MSGFLHRLAAQAMGKTNSLRSMSRQPYAAPALESTPVLEPEKQTDTFAATDHQQHNVDVSDAGLNYVPGQKSRRDFPSAEITVQAREQDIASPLSEVPVTRSKTARHNAESQALQAMMRQSAADQSTLQEPPVLVGGIEATSAMNNSAPAAIAGNNSALTDSGFPEPLLPASKLARHSILNASAAQRGDPTGSARQGQIEETTEVHVSIGRIEVTAVHETPATKRQAPVPAKAISLDEYLSRRRRET